MVRLMFILTFFLLQIGASSALDSASKYLRLAGKIVEDIGKKLEIYQVTDVTLGFCKDRFPDRYALLYLKSHNFLLNAEIILAKSKIAELNITDKNEIVALEVSTASWVAGYGAAFFDEFQLKLKEKSVEGIKNTCDGVVDSVRAMMLLK